LTLPELIEKLKDIDEVTLLERLGITSEDLLTRFVDLVEDRFDEFESEFDDPEEG